MKIKQNREDCYKKYKYLIWREDVGFLHLETFSSEDLKKFSKSLEEEIKRKKSSKETFNTNIKT
jgi:hypothetical protein